MTGRAVVAASPLVLAGCNDDETYTRYIRDLFINFPGVTAKYQCEKRGFHE